MASGVGLATITHDNDVLDVWFPHPVLGPHASERLGIDEAEDPLRRVTTRRVATFADLDAPPADVPDAYLRLHLLSHRMVKPNEVKLDGIEDLLTTVIWTDAGPCSTREFELVRRRLRSRNRGVAPRVYAVCKVPRMLDYVVPSGVQITQADSVRLGAYLPEGTVVLPTGDVEYNAGCRAAQVIDSRVPTGTFL